MFFTTGLDLGFSNVHYEQKIRKKIVKHKYLSKISLFFIFF